MSRLSERIEKIFKGRPFAAVLKNGAEHGDEKPLLYPVGLKRPPSQEERFRQMIAEHQRRVSESQEYADETDFDIDEPDMRTPSEISGLIYDMPMTTFVGGAQEAPKEPDGAPPTGTEGAKPDGTQ